MSYKELKTTKVYDLYWKFAAERQEVFFRRLNEDSAPWTEDAIISKYKFTNSYRASDRISQYLIKNVIYKEGCQYTPEDIVFRILLFKLFNKIETWEYLEGKLGDITYKNFDLKKYDKLFCTRIMSNERIYSAAYIMPSGKSFFGYERKHQNHLALVEHMMRSGFMSGVASAKSLKELYELLLSFPSLGSFLAFQYSIDINYSELCDFSEMSYVVAGPGAKNGIHKCFGDVHDMSYEDVIRYVAEKQEEEFEKRNIHFKSLGGRRLQLIDCQNLFCETDKYARVACPEIEGLNDRKRIKQQYIDRHYKNIEYFYPPKWKIDVKKMI